MMMHAAHVTYGCHNFLAARARAPMHNGAPALRRKENRLRGIGSVVFCMFSLFLLLLMIAMTVNRCQNMMLMLMS